MPSVEDAGSRARKPSWYRAAWAATIATVAAWPPGALAQPTVERRFVRVGSGGPLRECVVAALDDPAGTVSPAAASRELEEIVRPLLAVDPAALDDAGHLLRAGCGHASELRMVNSAIPEGVAALAPLLDALLDGLSTLRGSVALALSIAPSRFRMDGGFDPEDVLAGDAPAPEQDTRRVRFRLRLGADAAPVPLALCARAEALCLTRRPHPGSWFTPRTRDERIGLRAAAASGVQFEWDRDEPEVDPIAAAVTLGLLTLHGRQPARSPRRQPVNPDAVLRHALLTRLAVDLRTIRDAAAPMSGNAPAIPGQHEQAAFWE